MAVDDWGVGVGDRTVFYRFRSHSEIKFSFLSPQKWITAATVAFYLFSYAADSGGNSEVDVDNDDDDDNGASNRDDAQLKAP